MNIRQQLQQLDLSEQEIAAFLACLENGEGTLAQIVSRLGAPRSSTKYILEKLAKRGLIEIVRKNASHLYIPYPPRAILTLLKNRKNALEQQVDAFEASLPQLNQLYAASAEAPIVRYFRGDEIRKIYEEILASPIEETLFVGEMDKTAEVVGLKYLKSWMKRRAALHIKTRGIRVGKGEFKDPVVNSTSGRYLRTVRRAPNHFESPNHIIIYGNHVASIATATENFGFVITSKDYATTLKNLFKEVWKNSSPFRQPAQSR